MRLTDLWLFTGSSARKFIHALGRKRYLAGGKAAAVNERLVKMFGKASVQGFAAGRIDSLGGARRRAVALIDAEAGSGLLQALGQAEPARSAADNEGMERRHFFSFHWLTEIC
jgi:hypothetical protein